MATKHLPFALPADYPHWLASLKGRISAARSRAALAVNAELIGLYHQIGCDILQRQTQQAWGAKVIDRLAQDLKAAFPDMKGFSASNIKYMRYFAEHCPHRQIGQQPADHLPWFHIVTLLTKVADPVEREWYAVQAVAQGWSRLTLELNIQNQLKQRKGAAINNFVLRLPEPLATNLPSIEEIEAELADEMGRRMSRLQTEYLFAKPLNVGQAIKANLRGLGYGG